MATTFRTATEWYSLNPTLLVNELGIESDTGLMKIGPGAWNSLSYLPIRLAEVVHAATGKTTPDDADELLLVDSAAKNILKKLTWANLRAALGRAANGNQSANAFIPGVTSTPTAAATTTLTVDSTQIQEFTGATTQNCDMPTTGVVKGRLFVVDNRSTGLVTIRSSGGNTITYAAPGCQVVLYANTATPTTAAHWTVLSYSATTAYISGVISQALRDANNNFSARNIIPAQTITVTSGGTTALAVGSNFTQIATGTSGHTFTLPTTGVITNQGHEFFNSSTQAITINSSGGNLVKTLAAGAWCVVRALQSTPTTAAHWVASP